MSESLPPDASGPRPPGYAALFLSRVVVPLAFVVVAVACAGLMVVMRPSAARGDVATTPTRVDVVTVAAGSTRARIEATGVVEPARRVQIIPQVNAQVRWLSESLVPGGRLDDGEVFARLDARDFSLQAESARASVRSAALELELEQGRGTIARKEWSLLHPDRDPGEAPLALRTPQLETAKQALASAEASLGQAEVQLSRTRLSAPFPALVLDEALEVGQVVAPGAPVATLIGTETFWVTVSVPVHELGVVELPQGDRPGSPAVVQHDLGAGQRVVRTGAVTRMLAQLDPQTRTAQLQVAIPDPLQGEGVPLLPGAFVEVALEGRVLDDVVRVPRIALRDGQTVWTVDGKEGQGTLHPRTVQVGWKEGEDVLITDGLSDGDRVVVSPLALPLEGMLVEVLSDRDLPVDAPVDAAQ